MMDLICLIVTRSKAMITAIMPVSLSEFDRVSPIAYYNKKT